MRGIYKDVLLVICFAIFIVGFFYIGVVKDSVSDLSGRLRAIEENVALLKDHTHELEYGSYDKQVITHLGYGNVSISSQRSSITYEDAIKAILDHLGAEIEYVTGMKGHYKLTELEK